MPSRNERLNAIARRQHSLVTLAQLDECGFPPRVSRRMVEAGRLERVRRGVYRLCGAPPTWRAAALAAVLAAGGDAVLSHRSAAALWGLLDHHDLAGIDVLGRRLCRQPGIVSHRAVLRDQDRTARDGIPVTTVARTLVDLADCHDVDELGKLVDDAIRRRITTAAKVHAVAGALPVRGRRGRGRPTLTTVLARRGVGYDPGANDWEQGMDHWWDRAGLPTAVRQYKVRVGRRTYVLDRAIPELMLGIEWNGRHDHGTRSGFEYDSDRRSRLQAAGWRILDFHYGSHPEFILRTVMQLCSEQRRLLHLPAQEGDGIEDVSAGAPAPPSGATP